MDPVLGFFDVADPLAINAALTLTGAAQWIVQSETLTAAQTRVQGLATNGDEGAYMAIDGKTSGTVTYECQKPGGVGSYLTLPLVGQVYGNYHIDSMKLTYKPNGWPTLECTVHNHAVNPHTTGSCHTYTPGLTAAPSVAQFPAGFGVPTSILDNAGAPATYFSMLHLTVGIKSLTISLSVTHKDETGSMGSQLAGNNRDGKESIEAEFVGIPTVVTVYPTFTQINAGSTTTNQAADTAKHSYERHILRTS